MECANSILDVSRKEKQMTKNQEKILQQIIDHYGRINQEIKCIKEMGELTKELAKDVLTLGSEENIIEETADVLITVTQVMMMHSPEKVKKVISQKLYRTMYRMENESYDK